MATVEEIREALGTVNDPDLHKDLVSLGMVKDIQVDGGKVQVTVELTTPACPLKAQIRQECEEAISKVAGVEQVTVELTAQTRGSRSGDEAGEDLLPGVKNIILVASGKGGVGKSSVAINLAACLARTGARTGLLDADIYGPSIPTMMGILKEPMVTTINGEEKILPVEAHGISLISIGFFLKPEQAVMWRGPMLHKALQQFIGDVHWGELDYLVVDVPPGTGDVHLSFSQLVKATGAVLVTTPQTVALADVIRGNNMFEKVKVPVLGLVENMSYFVCDQCDKEHDIFSRGGGAQFAKELEIPFLGEVPLITQIREACDQGVPAVMKDPAGAAAKAFQNVTDAVVAQVAVMAVQSEPALKLV